MPATTIDPATLAILKTAEVSGNTVRLTCGQLDRKAYQAVNDTLARMGGKWKGGKVSAHVFDRDPAPILAEVLGDGRKPEKNPLAYFATPPGVAREMIALAEIPHSDERVMTILEPSAGDGAILRVILADRGWGHIFYTCEIDHVRNEILKGLGAATRMADFLAISPEVYGNRQFDRVLMNPPFTSPADPHAYVAHIRHAFDFLGPGGRLVAVAPAGFTFTAGNRKLAEFREFVGEHGHWRMLPEGSFRESGTGVNCCLVAIDRPK